MRIGKLWLVAILSVMPVAARAQVSVGVNVNLDLNAYDTSAPGDPVASVDVFYDQLSPYGVWVDDPDIGRVFIPQEDAYVPYTVGHWEYTRLGFVWVSSERFGWATSHYGRWAYSNPYGRWVWLPDTEWGPAWVEWRQTSTDFGWAPLPPPRVTYTPPPESWHYCGANHILDVNVTRYYEPRDRVVVIHREARPIEHYQTVSNVRVNVGPPPSVLHEHRIEVKPARVEAKVIGRWTPTEAHAQVQRAQERRQTFEVDNQKRLEANTRVHAVQQKVIETHPQIKVQAEARLKVQPTRAEPAKPMPAPNHAEPQRAQPHPMPPDRVEAHPGQPSKVEPARPQPNKIEPARPEPRPAQPNKLEPGRSEPRPAQPTKAEPARPEPRPAQPNKIEPTRPEPRPAQPTKAEPARPEPRPVQPNRVEPARPEPRPAQPNRVEPARPTPQPARPEPARPTPPPAHVESRPEPARPNPQPQPARPEPRPEPARPAAPPAHAEPAKPAPTPGHAEPAHPAPHHEPDKK